MFGKEEKTLYAFTLFGKLVYLGATVLFVSYAIILYDGMMSHSKDNFKSMKTANDMDRMGAEDPFTDHLLHQQDDHPEITDVDSMNKTLLIKRNNEFFLNDLNFMPVYEIKSLKQPSENETFDIF